MKSHFKTSRKHVNGKGRLEQAREQHAEHIENYFMLILKETFNLYIFFWCLTNVHSFLRKMDSRYINLGELRMDYRFKKNLNILQSN